MKKKILIIICVVIAFIALFPKKLGTNGSHDVYFGLIYSVDVYKEGGMSLSGEALENESGVIVELFGLEVFNNVD